MQYSTKLPCSTHVSPRILVFAIQYAVQVSNYAPIKTNASALSIPHYMAYKEPPDYRKLLPLFLEAYLCLYESGEGNTFKNQTIKAILVGNDTKSDTRLFHNPSTKKLLALSDFCLNVTGPSGPIFNLPYKEPTTYSLYMNLYPLTQSHSMQQGTIIDIPFLHCDPYTIQLKEDQTIIQVMPFHILPYDPTNRPIEDSSGLLISHL